MAVSWLQNSIDRFSMADAYSATMEKDIAQLQIEDEEDELMFDQIDEGDIEEDLSLRLVGKVLTNGVVHFPSLKIYWLRYGTQLRKSRSLNWRKRESCFGFTKN